MKSPRFNRFSIIDVRVFKAGILIFFLGTLGLVWEGWSLGRSQLERVFSDEVVLLAQLDLKQVPLDDMRTQMLLGGASEIFGLEVAQFEDWVGRNIGLAVLENGQKIGAAQYRNKAKAEKFLQQFLVEGESFVLQERDYGTLLLPSFSSQKAFLFQKGWLFWADEESALEKALVGGVKPLHKSEAYKEINKDLSDKAILEIFINIEDWNFQNLEGQPGAVYKPLLEAMGKTLPAGGLVLVNKDGAWQLESKFLLHEKAYQDELVAKPKNKTIPDLARFVPRDTLFFINGTDLYAKYIHTKQFLSELDPQFPVIFDGLLRAQTNRIFGAHFDFEKDFLHFARGQYAFVVDFERRAQLSFLTHIDSGVSADKLSSLHSTIGKAQAQFAHKIQKVELPDGTVREELVALDPGEVPIVEDEYREHNYFVAKNLAAPHQFAYGMLDNYFLFTTDEEALKNIFDIRWGNQAHLAENTDFRSSVLFNFSASESYGFLNLGAFVEMIDFMESVQGERVNFYATQLSNYFRNITFARKVFPGEVFVKALLFER